MKVIIFGLIAFAGGALIGHVLGSPFGLFASAIWGVAVAIVGGKVND